MTGPSDRDKGSDAGRAGPRTLDLGEVEPATERNAAGDRETRDPSRPSTVAADRTVGVADTLYAQPEDDAIAWPARPGAMVRLVRWMIGTSVLLTLTGIMGALVSAFFARMLSGDGIWPGLALAGVALLLGVLVLMAVRDLIGLIRLGSVAALRQQAIAARRSESTQKARRAVETIVELYRRRADMEWPIAAFRDDMTTVDGAVGILDALDSRVLAPLDSRARRVAADAARRAAVITAVSPFPILDMLATLSLTIRAAHRVAAIYGVRPGGLGTVTLVRRAFFTVIAAGAIDAADDLVGDLLGSGLATRLSRRAGVGVLNGLLVARLSLAMIDEIRPLPWRPGCRPSPHSIVREAVVAHRE